MFDAFCPHCRRRVLLGPTSIVELRSVDGGIAVRYRCPCGGSGTELIASRRARPAPATASLGVA